MREKYNIINPVAGSGKVSLARKIAAEVGGEIYYTKDENDIERFVISQLGKNPYTHFIIYGGDGSLNCCVNGVMKAGCGKTAGITAFSLGSGNDFLHYMNNEYLPGTTAEEISLDVIEADGKYSINMLNTGFDCDVVVESDKFRNNHHILGGKLSYTAGVLTTLFKKKTFSSNIKLTYANGDTEEFSGEWLLIAAGNCPYYGGGYKAAPLARPDDGVMDVLLVGDIGRARFVASVLNYKTGSHLAQNTPNSSVVKVKDKYSDFMSYRRCVKMEYDTASELCYDGEIHKAGRVEAKVIPAAVKYIPLGVVRSKNDEKVCGGETVNAL